MGEGSEFVVEGTDVQRDPKELMRTLVSSLDRMNRYLPLRSSECAGMRAPACLQNTHIAQ